VHVCALSIIQTMVLKFHIVDMENSCNDCTRLRMHPSNSIPSSSPPSPLRSPMPI
jgi:hypothetical protein